MQVLGKVVAAFSRDEHVRQLSAVRVHELVFGVGGGGEGGGGGDGPQAVEQCVPPSGVQPFRGFVSYAAPLCYLFDAPAQLYFVLRGLWCRYFCKLNVLSSGPQTLLRLCATFEALLLEHDAELFAHLVDVGVPPLSVAFPWIHLAFSGYLHTEQTLLLWDRVVGFDSLDLLPALAAAIFAFRSRTLMAAADPEEVTEILADPGRLQVIPLLQFFLFAGELD